MLTKEQSERIIRYVNAMIDKDEENDGELKEFVKSLVPPALELITALPRIADALERIAEQRGQIEQIADVLDK